MVAPNPAQIWSDFSGTLVAVDSAVIRPKVNGRITEIRFRDAQNVKAGQVLLVIDPRSYEATLPKATLTAAQSIAIFTEKELKRHRTLVKTDAIAQLVLDERVATSESADAALQVAQASFKQAQLDVEYAYVKAPISGRVGRAEITVGKVSQAGANAPVLTSIVANDAVYADFEVDEKPFLKEVHGSARGENSERNIPVELTLRGDAVHVYQEFIHAFYNQISSSSGTIRARAKFANTDGGLMAGMFALIKKGSTAIGESILIPERAVNTIKIKSLFISLLMAIKWHIVKCYWVAP